jgi:hypothetical protein
LSLKRCYHYSAAASAATAAAAAGDTTAATDDDDATDGNYLPELVDYASSLQPPLLDIYHRRGASQ